MKLSVKTLTGTTFPIEAEADETVAQLKVKVHAAQGFEPDTQKLIYAGKILKDDQALSTCGVKENDFLACMVSKVSDSARAHVA